MSSLPVFLRYGTLLTHSALVRLLLSAAVVVLLAALTYWAVA
ncbi:hypothetical protein [Erwinia billingiae]|jgi:hypothetical protein|nr:hypothetical protein [Erwinia billingiae]